MQWVSSTLNTTSENVVSIITTADGHTSATESRVNLRPRRFKWPGPFRLKTKCDSCTCAITFLLASIALYIQKFVYVVRLCSLAVGSYSTCISQYISIYLNTSQYI